MTPRPTDTHLPHSLDNVEADRPEAAPADASTTRPEAEGAEIALPEDALILIPTRNLVLFPGIVMPLTLGRAASIAAAQEAVRRELPIGVVLQRDPQTEDPGAPELYEIGTSAGILRYLTGENGAHHLVCQGQARFRVKEMLDGYPFLVARIEEIEAEEGAATPEIEARAYHVRERAREVLELLPETPGELLAAVQGVELAGALADLVASFMDLKPVERQSVLETLDLAPRLDRVLEYLNHRVQVLRVSNEIGEQTRDSLQEQQREHLLREQMETIRKQLGEDDDNSVEIAELSEAIERADMPEEAEQQARKELKRLERIPEAAAEYSMVRTYLDWLIELPWAEPAVREIDIAAAREILDADHYGLGKVKKRILEFLAVHKLSPKARTPILCFVGPPGVGKTSLGRSIARAAGREFVRASLGGVHDEAEIRGHRRTYVGALPGNVIQSIRKAGARDCVFMLDELDKLGAGVHGDPSSAMLEVLDPEQNDSFRDNYLGVPYDLSKVMFIGTANVPDQIPGPLRDRMEIIELPGYTEDEKLEIARRYLVARQLAANGLKPGQCEISEDALRAIIRAYTREAGVRNLEREIGAAMRNAAMQIAEGEADTVAIGPDDLHDILGAERFENEVAMRTSVPGVATGLAWTPAGGDILFVEAARMPGNGKLILTGQLGDVMKESAQAALTLVKGRAEALGIDPALFEKSDIHIHVPAGAIPKDGPSAGISMYTALVSLLSGRCVRSDTAMTGEISLRGLVLPIGGVKEKVVAAVRAGIATIMLPARNRKDLEDVPESARSQAEFVWLERVEDAIEAALDGAVRPTSHTAPTDEGRGKTPEIGHIATG